MSIYNLGRVIPIFKGEYNNETEYKYLDVVLYNGSSYVVVKDSTTGNLPTNTEYWAMVAHAGELSPEQIANIEQQIIEYVQGQGYVIDANYTHTDNNFTNADKTKLEGVDMSTKQDTLVSGTNIKTINNQSLLGSGNIASGTTDYDELTDKPSINNIILSGNKTTSDLGINIPGVINDITTGGTTDALSAEMGKELKEAEDALDTRLDVIDTFYNKEDVISQAIEVTEKRIAPNGTLAVSLEHTNVYKFDNINFAYLLINAGTIYDSNSACIVAFYNRPVSEETFTDSGYCIKKIPNDTSKTQWIVEVPAAARCIAITNTVSVVPSPSIIAYKNPADIRTKLFHQRNQESITGTINNSIDVSAIPNNSQLIITVNELSGDSTATFAVFNTTETGIVNSIKLTEAGQKVYIQKTETTKKIRLYKGATDGNVLNYSVEYIPLNTPIDFRTFSGYEEQPTQELNIGKFIQGRYRNFISDLVDTTGTTYVTTLMQYKTGFVVRVSATDYTNYTITFQRWGSDFKSIGSVSVDEQKDFDLSETVAWSVLIKKSDNSSISVEEAMSVLSITYVSGTIYEKSAPISLAIRNSDELQIDKETRYIYDEFCEKPFIYHYAPNGLLKDGLGRNLIGGQSEDDIRTASRLGFKWIEANINKTSDNKYFVMHPNQGGGFGQSVFSLDNTDITDVSVNSKTLAWIKENVRFASVLPKYQTAPLSIEEFCMICRDCEMGIMAGISGDENIIPIVRNIMGDNMMVYGAQPTVRNIFKGIVFEYLATPTLTVDNIVRRAEKFGRPCIIALGNNLYDAHVSAGTIGTLISELHRKGYLTNLSYVNAQHTIDGFNHGIDTVSASYQVNKFDGGIVYDINKTVSPFGGTGAITDNVATLLTGETITLTLTDTIPLAKALISMKFNGSLRIVFGTTAKELVSDGTFFVVASDYILQNTASLTITALANTTINELVYKVQEC